MKHEVRFFKLGQRALASGAIKGRIKVDSCVRVHVRGRGWVSAWVWKIDPVPWRTVHLTEV
jgi:hypothetical protein